jgi:hypothetical protein
MAKKVNGMKKTGSFSHFSCKAGSQIVRYLSKPARKFHLS